MTSISNSPSSNLMNSQIYQTEINLEQKLTLSGFEGPEKLLEIWFERPPTDYRPSLSRTDTSDSELSEMEAPIHHYATKDVIQKNGLYKFKRTGLRTVDQSVWEDMLKIVQCQVLSTLKNEFVDAYLLSESSMFVYKNRLMLKTCGTTTLLHAVPRILEIAKEHCKLDKVEAIFYSRKSFLFPERQEFPHGKFGDEVAYLDNIFVPMSFETSGYVVGKINGDHWCLYVGTPLLLDSDGNSIPDDIENDEDEDDITLEILMTDLNQDAMKTFWRTKEELAQGKLPHNIDAKKHVFDGQKHRIYNESGIAKIYPESLIDDYAFDPCGYSANGLLGPYYYTIHVTPEDICSYASFETTIPVKAFLPKHTREGTEFEYTSFNEVVQKVVDVFQPGKFSTTLFVRHTMKSHLQESLLEKPLPDFRQRDRIIHSLGKWEMVFSHYELEKSPNPAIIKADR
ncbi:spermidine resistance protein [Boothiomyces sp. JEL0838]|nr:spermidine resistance protein [Boothiomyces sp. JEL0838]